MQSVREGGEVNCETHLSAGAGAGVGVDVGVDVGRRRWQAFPPTPTPTPTPTPSQGALLVHGVGAGEGLLLAHHAEAVE